MKVFYFLIKCFIRLVLFSLFRVEVKGKENAYKAMKSGKKLVVVSNHISYMDGTFVGCALPMECITMMYTSIANKFPVRYILKCMNILKVDEVNAMALKHLINGVNDGKAGLIFPEGRVTNTRCITGLYDGASMVIDKTGADVLPVTIEGPQYSKLIGRMHHDFPMRLFPKVTIYIHPAVSIDIPESCSKQDRIPFITQKVYDILCEGSLKRELYIGTLFELLLEARKKWGSKHDILQGSFDDKMNYGRLITGSFVLGAQVKKIAAKHNAGKKIGIMLPPCIPATVLFFGVQAYRLIPTMINFTSGASTVIKSCKLAGVKMIFTSLAFVEKGKYESITQGLEEAGIRVVYLEDVKKQIGVLDKLGGLFRSKLGLSYYKLCNRNLDVNALAAILFTSGSSGAPKAVALSHKNLFTNTKQFESRIDISSKDIIFSALPIFHIFGLNVCMILPITVGMRVFLYPNPLAYNLIPYLVRQSDATVLAGTDTLLSMYINKASQYDFSHLRYVISGAEKLRESTRNEWFYKAGKRILEGYGVTETSPMISFCTPVHYKKGSVGRALPGISCRLSPVEGIHSGSKLIVKGDTIMLGYLSEDGSIRAPSFEFNGKEEAGWYDTGDIVDIDKNGFITIIGRAKRFAKIGGEMISLTAIEEYLFAWFPDDRHAMMNRYTDSGEVLVLFTTRQNTRRLEINQLLVDNGLSAIWAPSEIIIKDEIPLLGSGKTNYVKLQEELQESR